MQRGISIVAHNQHSAGCTFYMQILTAYAYKYRYVLPELNRYHSSASCYRISIELILVRSRHEYWQFVIQNECVCCFSYARCIDNHQCSDRGRVYRTIGQSLHWFEWIVFGLWASLRTRMCHIEWALLYHIHPMSRWMLLQPWLR